MFGTRLKELREKQNLSQRQLAKILKTSPSSVAMYELDQRSPDKEMISLISTFFQVPTDYLLGLTNNPIPYFNAVPDGTEQGKAALPLGEANEIPVYKLDVKGEEIFADSNIIGRHYVPAEQMDCICFRVPDDSMSGSGLYTDYIVIVKKQTTAEDGQVAIVKIKDGPARIRRVRYFNDEVLLDPDNPRYQSERININKLDIIGVVTDASFKVK